jgi:hypothetical protein
MKCACEHNCTCDVNQGQGVERGGKRYCSETCADGHPRGQGCGHQGCGC